MEKKEFDYWDSRICPGYVPTFEIIKVPKYMERDGVKKGDRFVHLPLEKWMRHATNGRGYKILYSYYKFVEFVMYFGGTRWNFPI